MYNFRLIKKILVICPQFNEEYKNYQPWKQIFFLGKELIKKNVDFAIGTEATEQQQIDGVPILNFTQKNLRKLSKTSKDKIIRFNPDIIYWVGNPLSGFYIKKNKINNIPIVLFVSTVHPLWNDIKHLSIKEIFQLNFLNFFTAFFPFYKIVKSLNHQNISGIVVSNNTIKTRLKELGVNQNKIVVSPFFFETDITFNMDFDYEKTTFTICYLGPNNTIRGIDIVLDIIKKFKKENMPIQAQILLRTTNTTEKDILEQKCKQKQIDDVVEINAGLLERELLFKKIASSHVVIFPTKLVWNEPPLSILEAMSLGKTVITSNVGGLPELVNHYGFVVSPKTESFFSVLKHLSKNRHKIIDSGKKAKNYSQSLKKWNEMADWTLQILNEFSFKKKY